MPRRLVIGTRNRRKFAEIAALLRGLDVDLVSLDAFPGQAAVPETGATFQENAQAKALGYARATGQWALADDSGLEVDALGGEPGVRSSRWAGHDGNDHANNRRLMEALAGKPQPWTARYRCAIAVATPERVLLTAEGSCEGRITDRPAGRGGFGYDPHFHLEERGCTMAELPADEKNRLSHRARALQTIRARLEKLL